MISANELALAFNQQNARKTWSARPSNTLVHFNPGTGLVTLVYDTVDGRWQVRFNKYQAAWGDYVKAIARTFYVVLTTLQSAGLPFAAPDQPEGIDIITTVGAEGSIYVRYDPPAPDPMRGQPVDPTPYSDAKFAAPELSEAARYAFGDNTAEPD